MRAPGERKYGAYAVDAAVLAWVRDGAPERRRCLEAQIMDWADDVAYSVHDVEDGLVSGRIDLAALATAAERDVLVDLAARHFGGEPGALTEAARDLWALPVVADVVAAGVTSAAGQLALKRLTSGLVGRFVVAATDATRAAHGDGPLARYAADLVVPPTAAAEVALLKAVALRFVMRDPPRLAMQARQRELLTELAEALLAKAPDALDPVFAAAWAEAPDDPARPAGGGGPGGAADRPAGRRPPPRHLLTRRRWTSTVGRGLAFPPRGARSLGVRRTFTPAHRGPPGRTRRRSGCLDRCHGRVPAGAAGPLGVAGGERRIVHTLLGRRPTAGRGAVPPRVPRPPTARPR